MSTPIENGSATADPAPRTLGTGGPEVSRLCLGTSSWSRARFGAGPVEALETVLDAGGVPSAGPAITFIDTSNEYGGGASESYLGDAIRRRGALPAGMVLQTKLDRDPDTGSFSGERMRASLAESLGKLGLERVPMLYLHDPELIGWDEAFAADGPVRALVEMQERGLVDAIGISGGPAPMLTRYVETGLFSAVITHNRYTLVDRSAEQLVDEAVWRGVSVINAAVYGGGALARWPEAARSYAYRPAPAAMANAIADMGLACQRAGVSLAAAALQFSTRDPRITSTIVGGNSIAQVQEAIAADAVEIPAGLWAELEALAPDPAVWQDPPGSSWP
ncbi:aldo/keto reductase [Cryobacterium sp. PAMC25264]|uniref:aldo/keto reductase n=1 Tax=Cryobacterium sp. PAMC25264 TaxID=2861288 RepID=UPI001C628A43|nr:aldo/keto reductase [Cryobacterium sp. PAMC25264]QYF73386.1 aldo/keto reductase [Cryobacterium sp. PAMC25264]